MIQRVNDLFVSTTITFHELKKLADTGDPLARETLDHWQSPVNLMFLTQEGRFISKLSSLTDLTDVHPETSLRPGQRKTTASAQNNTRVFLDHVTKHFGDSSSTSNPRQ